MKNGGRKILVVESDEDLSMLIRSRLSREGFRVLAAEEGEEAMRRVSEEIPDLVILDLVLPGLDGYAVCQQLRRSPETAGVPILILSGKAEDADRVIGVELGADDFVTKPCHPQELVARVRALLRRASKESPARVLRLGEIDLDLDRYVVRVAGEEVRLTWKEFELLRTLMEARGRALHRGFLMERVWGYDRDARIESRTLNVHVQRLREKLGKEGKRILTVRNVGYRMDVSPVLFSMEAGEAGDVR